MYIYYALVDTLSTRMLYTDLNMKLYTQVEHNHVKIIYIKYYMETHTHTQTAMNLNVYDTDLYHTCTHVYTHTHTHTH